MHFRMRSNVVQMIRTTYDADSKRGKNEVVGTVQRRNMVLSDQIAAKLTAEEKQEFETFAEAYRNSTALQAKVYAYQIADIAQQAIAAAEAAEGADHNMMIANLTAAASEIRKFVARKQKA